MLSLQPSPCYRPSILHQSSAQTYTAHRRGFLVFAKENRELYAQTSSRKLQAQDFSQTVISAPLVQKLEDVEKLRSIGELKTLSQLSRVLSSLVTEDEFKVVALELKSNLLSFGLVPDYWTYSILVHCYCKEKKPIEAKIVLEDMLNNGFKPNVATLTTLINSFCESGKMQNAFEVFDKMPVVECEPTINTYNCLLKGLCYVGRVEKAYELLMKIKKLCIKPDIYTYTALMDGFCKVGRSNEALEFLDEAIEMGLAPNVVTYNTLFNGYFKEGRPLSGIRLLRRMKEKNCKPDCISYSTLLHGLLKWGKTKAALQIYKEMVEIGFVVDERMMNTLLRGLCRRSRKEKEFLKDVYDLLDKMKTGNYTIYPCAYDLVIEALINGQEIEKAYVGLNEMVEIGLSPRAFTFNIVIQALCFIGEVDKAAIVLTLMLINIKHSGIPFSVLINELNRQGRLLDTRIVYGVALKREVVPKRKPGKYLEQTKQ